MKTRYFFAVLILIGLRAVDLGLTYYYTRDLAYEWNPLVSIFGSGWIEMVIIQLLVIFLIVLLMSFYFSYDRTKHIPAPGLSMSAFYHDFFFHTAKPMPENLNFRSWNYYGMLVLNGFVLMWGAISVQVFAIIHNALVLMQVEAYETFVFHYFTPYFIGVFFLIGMGAIYAFFHREYRIYQSIKQ